MAMLTIKTVLRTVLERVRLEADGTPEAIVRNNMTLAPGRGAMVRLTGPRRAPVRGVAAGISG
jgi:cytochrome P450